MGLSQTRGAFKGGYRGYMGTIRGTIPGSQYSTIKDSNILGSTLVLHFWETLIRLHELQSKLRKIRIT